MNDPLVAAVGIGLLGPVVAGPLVAHVLELLPAGRRRALEWLIGVSTLFTKQHYVVDVIGGIAAGCLAYVLFLRSDRREPVPERERARAPRRALAAVAVFAVMIAGCWVAYHFDP